MVLHESQPLEVVVVVGRLLQKLVRLALEDAQNAAFLLRPGGRRHAEILEIAGEGAVERPALIALAAKCPVGVRRIDNQLEKRLPGFQPEDAVGPTGRFTSCHLLCIVAV